MTANSESLQIPILGLRVVEILSEYALVLIFADGTRIRIEMPLRLRLGDDVRTYDPQNDTGELADFQRFVGSVVSEAVATGEGALRLVLDRSATFEVDPSETYEAWEFVGLNRSHIVALGDRSLAIWDPSEHD